MNLMQAAGQVVEGPRRQLFIDLQCDNRPCLFLRQNHFISHPSRPTRVARQDKYDDCCIVDGCSNVFGPIISATLTDLEVPTANAFPLDGVSYLLHDHLVFFRVTQEDLVFCRCADGSCLNGQIPTGNGLQARRRCRESIAAGSIDVKVGEVRDTAQRGGDGPALQMRNLIGFQMQGHLARFQIASPAMR